MRKIDLTKLPTNSNGIKWKECIGYKIPFTYEETTGELEIIEYLGDGLLKVLFEAELFTMHTWNIKHCHLGKYLDYRTSKFKIEIGEIFKNLNRDLTILDREIRNKKIRNNNIKKEKWYKYICNDCGYIGWKIESSILKQNTGCPCCQKNSHIVLRKGVNDIATTEPWMVKYFKNKEDSEKYVKTSTANVDMVCPFCGKVHNKSIALLRANKGLACVCKDKKSYNEKFIYNLLEQLNIDFLDEVSFKWCVFKAYNQNRNATGIYDFVIESIKLIIECDGDWHNRYNTLSGKTKDESKYIDDMKDELAKINGYKIIRIDCKITDNKYITNGILNSDLNSFFDLSTINFSKCDEFAQSNFVKLVCDYYNDNDVVVKDLVKIFKLYKGTIRRYLHNGTRLGWCNYNKSIAYSKSKKGINNYKNRIPIKCNELNIYFTCAKDFIIWYKEKHNKNANSGCICNVCNGKSKSHLGLTFQYITKEQFNTIKSQSPKLAYGDFFILED